VARTALDAAAFTAAWTAGQAMGLEQAIADALHDDADGRASRQPAAPENPALA
jgi:hypothetical protein